MGGDVRWVAGTYVLLGMAVAYFALYAIALDTAMFPQLQLLQLHGMIKDPHKQQLECAAKTAAAVKVMRAGAGVLLLLAAAQTMTAVVGVAGRSRLLTVCAQIQSIPMAMRLLAVLAGVADLAIGSCHGHDTYPQLLVVGVCLSITMSFLVLFMYGLIVAFGGQLEDCAGDLWG